MSGSTVAGWIVCTPPPPIANAIVSTVGSGSPATHSPLPTPEAAFADAAVIASRNVHWPSSMASSPVLFTVIVAASAGAAASVIASPVARLKSKCRFMETSTVRIARMQPSEQTVIACR